MLKSSYEKFYKGELCVMKAHNRGVLTFWETREGFLEAMMILLRPEG